MSVQNQDTKAPLSVDIVACCCSVTAVYGGHKGLLHSDLKVNLRI